MSAYSPEIIKTLSDQVQTLAPLRESFQHLQNYYRQLTQDVSDLLSHTDLSEKELLSNLKYLEEIQRSLERQFGCCGQQLRQLECERARVEMEGKQQSVHAESLKKRQLLEMEQKATLEGRHKDLLEQNQKIAFSVSKFKEMIHNLELTIKSKEYENIDVERQIKKMELVNQKITQLNHSAEDNIDKTYKDNETTAEQIYQLQCKLETYDKLIEAKERQNKENVQNLIGKTDELEQLRNRRQYIEKLLEAELGEQREMTRVYGEMESVVAIKKDKLMFVQQENSEYEKQIHEEKSRQSNCQQELLRLKSYLHTLISTNQHLYTQLEKSCSQDRDVQVMLSDKLEKLMVMNDKIAQNEVLNSRVAQPSPLVFRERNMSPPGSPLSSSPKAGTLQDRLAAHIARGNDRVMQHQALRKQMSSTWVSQLKENRFA